MKVARPIAASSAIGFASHAPVTPSRAGRVNMAIIIKTNEREKARMADTMPLDRAVNIPLAKTLKPMNSNAIEQMRLPVTARS